MHGIKKKMETVTTFYQKFEDVPDGNHNKATGSYSLVWRGCRHRAPYRWAESSGGTRVASGYSACAVPLLLGVGGERVKMSTQELVSC